VLGFPCNQFGGQEPGTHAEIGQFCETSFGVTFPMFEKIEVNGEGRHPLYDALTQAADAEGHTGDIRWNFEKFLVSRDGEILARFSPLVEPEAPELIGQLEAALAK
jgi:glutathione peroxidase